MHLLLTVNSAFNLVNFRSGLIKALIADGHRLTALVPRDRYASKLEAMGCRVIGLTMDSKGLSPLRDGALLLALWQIFRRERPDIVLSFTIKNNIYGSLAARSLGIPFIPNVTGLGTAFLHVGWLTRLAHFLFRRAFARVPVVFFQNGDDSDLFLAQGLVRREQVRLLPGSGIDTARFTPLPPPNNGKVSFLLIARMLRDKGVVEFTEAARRVRESHPDAEFLLLGPLGVENRTAIARDTLESWVAEGAVAYLGETEDVRPVIKEADCIVLPSYREGTPRTLLEAAAMGRPIVTTDVPGCRTVVEDGQNGFLCAPRDPKDLARALRKMIEVGPEKRAEMGRAGRLIVEQRFDERLVIKAYRNEIEKLPTYGGRASASL